MQTLSFAVSHYLLLGALALLAYLFGRRATLAYTYRSAVERIAFSLALGLGIIAYLVFLCGMLGLLRASVLLALLGGGFILCYRVWWGWLLQLREIPAKLRSIPPKNLVFVLLVTLVALGLALPIMVLPLYPPTAFDATMYHLPYAKIYVEQRGIVFTPHLRYAVFPQTNEMLFTLAFLFADDILAQMIEFLLFANLLLVLLAGGIRFWSFRSGLWAGAILLGIPIAVHLGTIAYVDIGLTLYTTLGVYAFLVFRDQRHSKWLILSGLFCGIALGTKYLALPVIAMLGLAALAVSWQARNWRWPLLFVSSVLLLASPWMVRNYFYTGNPVFPLLHRQIGPRIGGARWSDAYTQEFFEDFSRKWKGKGLGTLLGAPAQLAYPLPLDPAKRYSTVYIIFLPALLVGAIRDQTIRWMIIFGGGHLLFWFLAAKDPRFLLPAIPFLAFALSASLDLVLTRMMRRVGLAGHVAATTLIAMFVAFPGWYMATTLIHAQSWIPVTAEERDLYLLRNLPAYSVYRTLNQRYGKNYTLYSIGTENMVYFADGAVFGDVSGPMSHVHLGLRQPGGTITTIAAPALHSELKHRGVDHLVISARIYRAAVTDKPDFGRFFQMVYQKNGYLLFALK